MITRTGPVIIQRYTQFFTPPNNYARKIKKI